MDDKSEKIQADLALGQICLVQDAEQKFHLQMRTDTIFYGIMDVFAEKSSAPQFIYQEGNYRRPMTPLEYQLFIKKLKEDIESSSDLAFRVFHIKNEIKRLSIDFLKSEKFNHICFRDLRSFSKTHNWTIDMYKEGKWHTARLAKPRKEDIFTVENRPMVGPEFLELINLAKQVFNENIWQEHFPRLFEDCFIDSWCRKIKTKSKYRNKNKDKGHGPRE